ncbi:uncharacterized protein EV422DRAFT_532863 [Fimicolochytrium jonesii]|uniref:uncharacterized protein n=1 Tax=Fimicolochytrium jonesii TaxID=1396493 RepID=UPI0022FEDCF2|nr:uncharacterized protein EV422DRAFT_532863 [Fimicolochytrium jonesii]KAI8819936.1 hypothetical protein EV422DRAFT_532863 [Fimicolochytrium jonesii]
MCLFSALILSKSAYSCMAYDVSFALYILCFSRTCSDVHVHPPSRTYNHIFSFSFCTASSGGNNRVCGETLRHRPRVHVACASRKHLRETHAQQSPFPPNL